MTNATPRNNYGRYWQDPRNRPEFYPHQQSLDPALYRPIGTWMGVLALPTGMIERNLVLGCWLVLDHAPPAYQDLIGQRVRLRWEPTAELNARFWGATRNVYFDEDSAKALAAGTVLPERVNNLLNVNPLESLAGAHPYDDVSVRLEGEVRVEAQPPDGGPPIVFVSRMPAEITGRYVALVQFVAPADGELYYVRHFDRANASFRGPEELVVLHEVVPDSNDTRNSAAAKIEQSPCNPQGWYIYGAQDQQGRFVVRGLAPRQLLRLEPQLYCDGVSEGMEYLRPKAWKRSAQKGEATTALLVGMGMTPHTGKAAWKAGDRGLMIHLFGGIGGNKTEPAARTPLYWGHFAFGIATVIEEPLSGELSFDIVYHQVYAHNPDGLTAGAHHYSHYSGDRQYGWAGIRPIQDLIIKLDGITGSYTIFGQPISALDQIVIALEVMEARYRIADGRGGTRVTASQNCAQDSAQSLYVAIRNISKLLAARPDVRAELTDTPEEARMFTQLSEAGEELRRVLLPWGSARDDWEHDIATLGGDGPGGLISGLGKAVSSWRTMLPPVAARAMAEVFLECGGSIWVLRTFQVGGIDPDVEPIVPNV
ncbi:MAG: hypothetical protein AB4911_10760 [Oscillochloridaceae bacterium umkhey_bin13]